MKLFFLALFSFSVSASTWMPESWINAGSKSGFSNQGNCETQTKLECFDIGQNVPQALEKTVIQVDDLGRPVYLKENTAACSDNSDCQTKFLALECAEGFSRVKNLDLLEVYCTKRGEGYHQKDQAVFVLDQAKLDAHNAQELLKAQEAEKESNIQIFLKRIDCGKRVIALMAVRNVPKNLNTAQVAQMAATYASIKGLLETASLNTAKAAIQAVVPDGILVTDDDKVALVAEIDKCLEAQ